MFRILTVFSRLPSIHNSSSFEAFIIWLINSLHSHLQISLPGTHSLLFTEHFRIQITICPCISSSWTTSIFLCYLWHWPSSSFYFTNQLNGHTMTLLSPETVLILKSQTLKILLPQPPTGDFCSALSPTKPTLPPSRCFHSLDTSILFFSLIPLAFTSISIYSGNQGQPSLLQIQ